MTKERKLAIKMWEEVKKQLPGWKCTEMPKDIENDARDLFKFFEDAEQVKEVK